MMLPPMTLLESKGAAMECGCPGSSGASGFCALGSAGDEVFCNVVAVAPLVGFAPNWFIPDVAEFPCRLVLKLEAPAPVPRPLFALLKKDEPAPWPATPCAPNC